MGGQGGLGARPAGETGSRLRKGTRRPEVRRPPVAFGRIGPVGFQDQRWRPVQGTWLGAVTRKPAANYEPNCAIPMSVEASLHPAALPAEMLLVQCEIRRMRRSGPGGQH